MPRTRVFAGLLGLITANILSGQVITTAAGTDWVYPGVSLPGLDAPLGTVTGVATDSKGNVFVSDYDNCLVLRLSSDGSLTIVAGTGKRGFSGDLGPATNAKLGGPTGLAIGPDGSLYIADSPNNVVRKVAVNGIITAYAGNGTPGFSGDDQIPANRGSLNNPEGIAVDSSGTLYIADTGNRRIRRVLTNGLLTTFAGTGNAGPAGDGGAPLAASFSDAMIALALAPDGFLVVDGDRIRKISGGTINTVAGGSFSDDNGDSKPALSAALKQPSAVAVSLDGTSYYILELGGQRLRKVSVSDKNFIITTVVQVPAASTSPASSGTPAGLAINANGFYLGDSIGRRLRQLTNQGSLFTVAGNGNSYFGGDGGPATSAILHAPAAVLADGAGGFYIADTLNHRVRKVAANGFITTVAGTGTPGLSGDGHLATEAQLNHPQGLALDTKGNLYIADTLNFSIRKVAPNGTMATVAGFGQSSQLGGIMGMVVDAAGTIYVADPVRRRVLKIVEGAASSAAGNGTVGTCEEGDPATGPCLIAPTGLALDGAGNLYVADQGHFKVYKVSNGKITTYAGNGVFGFSGDGGPATKAMLTEVWGISLDGIGNLFIADKNNNRVRKVTPDGNIGTVAGVGISTGTFAGDGGPATSAVLNQPLGVSAESNGNLLIADTGNDRLRRILVLPPPYTVQPDTLSMNFEATERGISPLPQTIDVEAAISGLSFTASVTTASGGNWLSLNPPSGTMPARVQVKVDPSKLDRGTYTGTITITAPNAAIPTAKLTVTFAVKAPTADVLAVDAQRLTLSGVVGGAGTTAQIQVTNAGTGSLHFTATAAITSPAGGTWLSVNPSSGNTASYAPQTLVVTAAVGSLKPGTYEGAVTISGAGTNFVVPVTLTVTAPQSTILLSVSGLSFNAVAQGGAPLPQRFGILNIGAGVMKWSVTASTLSGVKWLILDTSAGEIQRPFLDVSWVKATIDPAGLTAGVYYAQIEVTANGSNSPQSLTVVLTVLPPGSKPGIELQPTGMLFIGSNKAANPASQSVTLGNPKGQPDSYRSASVGKGFSYTPINGNAPPNVTNPDGTSSQPAIIRVDPDYSNLTPGSVEKGTIVLQFANDTAKTVEVTLVVVPAELDNVGHRSESAADCTSQGLVIQYRAPQAGPAGFTAVLGQPLTVEAIVADHCGTILNSANSSGVALAFANGDDTAKLTYVGDGVWTGTWRPVNGSPGPTAMTVSAVTSEGGKLISDQASLAGVLAQGSPMPIISARGVTHTASILPRAGAAIAPGSMISIFGANLADEPGQAASLPWPTTLNGTQVKIGDRLMPIQYASPFQINVQAPYDLPVNTQYQLTIRHRNFLSVPQQLVTALAQPGIFTKNQVGTGQGDVLHTDYSFAEPGNPASAGEVVVIYCTGLGGTSGLPQAGQLPPPNAVVSNGTTVTIGGRDATVLFSGLSPQFAGLYQINAVVPSGIAPGNEVPVIVTAAGQASPSVTMAVK